MDREFSVSIDHYSVTSVFVYCVDTLFHIIGKIFHK